MNNSKFFCFFMFSLLLVMTCSTAFANVQSRPDKTRLVSTTVSEFFALTRQMETAGNALGLTATVDAYGNETSATNDIDAHMAKNTEYGAAAMLSASAYGVNAKLSVNETDSTTGNKYGLYDMANYSRYTYTASMWSAPNQNVQGNITNLMSAPLKYKDVYSSAAGKVGDATTETSYWKGASYADFVNPASPVFGRLSGMFGYGNLTGGSYSRYSARAVVVCGAGF